MIANCHSDLPSSHFFVSLVDANVVSAKSTARLPQVRERVVCCYKSSRRSIAVQKSQVQRRDQTMPGKRVKSKEAIKKAAGKKKEEQQSKKKKHHSKAKPAAKHIGGANGSGGGGGGGKAKV